MALETPGCPAANALPPLASRFLKVADLPWKPTQVEGIEMKVLMQDKESGLLTALFRWQPGTELPLHEHVEVEQTYVLEGPSWMPKAKCARATTSGVRAVTSTWRAHPTARWC